MSEFTTESTIGEIYGPAMTISDPFEAGRYFERIVRYLSGRPDVGPDEAENVARRSLGYYAGYYDSATRERVERLFRCAHPILGSIEANGVPSAGAALTAGWSKATNEAPPPGWSA